MKGKIHNIEFELTNGRIMLVGYSPAILTCSDLNLEISLSYYRSILKNQELLHKILEFTINEIKNENSNKENKFMWVL